jgi:DNA-binding NarL/FixJ family response regulator
LTELINFKTGKIFPFLPEKTPATGDAKLTAREKEVLQLVTDGYLSKGISNKFAISVHTVNTHRQRILEKLEFDNSMEAIAFAARLGLVK